MTVPNIDTFEHDISEELKNKEASIGDIASASGTIGNTQSSTNTTDHVELDSKKVVLFVTVCLVILLGLVGGYLYFFKKTSVPTQTPTVQQTTVPANTENVQDELNAVSPYLSQGIIAQTSHVERTPFGTAITIRDYRTVFGYMIAHEKDVAIDMLAGTYEVGSTTPTFDFIDVTESNQNMRMTQAGSSTLYYAFVDEQHLVFATTSANIIALRNVTQR